MIDKAEQDQQPQQQQQQYKQFVLFDFKCSPKSQSTIHQLKNMNFNIDVDQQQQHKFKQQMSKQQNMDSQTQHQPLNQKMAVTTSNFSENANKKQFFQQVGFQRYQMCSTQHSNKPQTGEKSILQNQQQQQPISSINLSSNQTNNKNQQISGNMQNCSIEAKAQVSRDTINSQNLSNNQPFQTYSENFQENPILISNQTPSSSFHPPTVAQPIKIEEQKNLGIQQQQLQQQMQHQQQHEESQNKHESGNLQQNNQTHDAFLLKSMNKSTSQKQIKDEKVRYHTSMSMNMCQSPLSQLQVSKNYNKFKFPQTQQVQKRGGEPNESKVPSQMNNNNQLLFKGEEGQGGGSQQPYNQAFYQIDSLYYRNYNQSYEKLNLRKTDFEFLMNLPLDDQPNCIVPLDQKCPKPIDLEQAIHNNKIRQKIFDENKISKPASQEAQQTILSKNGNANSTKAKDKHQSGAHSIEQKLVLQDIMPDNEEEQQAKYQLKSLMQETAYKIQKQGDYIDQKNKKRLKKNLTNLDNKICSKNFEYFGNKQDSIGGVGVSNDNRQKNLQKKYLKHQWMSPLLQQHQKVTLTSMGDEGLASTQKIQVQTYIPKLQMQHQIAMQQQWLRQMKDIQKQQYNINKQEKVEQNWISQLPRKPYDTEEKTLTIRNGTGQTDRLKLYDEVGGSVKQQVQQGEDYQGQAQGYVPGQSQGQGKRQGSGQGYSQGQEYLSQNQAIGQGEQVMIQQQCTIEQKETEFSPIGLAGSSNKNRKAWPMSINNFSQSVIGFKEKLHSTIPKDMIKSAMDPLILKKRGEIKQITQKKTVAFIVVEEYNKLLKMERIIRSYNTTRKLNKRLAKNQEELQEFNGQPQTQQQQVVSAGSQTAGNGNDNAAAAIITTSTKSNGLASNAVNVISDVNLVQNCQVFLQLREEPEIIERILHGLKRGSRKIDIRSVELLYKIFIFKTANQQELVNFLTYFFLYQQGEGIFLTDFIYILQMLSLPEDFQNLESTSTFGGKKNKGGKLIDAWVAFLKQNNVSEFLSTENLEEIFNKNIINIDILFNLFYKRPDQ